jgi:hypothetical protein
MLPTRTLIFLLVGLLACVYPPALQAQDANVSLSDVRILSRPVAEAEREGLFPAPTKQVASAAQCRWTESILLDTTPEPRQAVWFVDRTASVRSIVVRFSLGKAIEEVKSPVYRKPRNTRSSPFTVQAVARSQTEEASGDAYGWRCRQDYAYAAAPLNLYVLECRRTYSASVGQGDEHISLRMGGVLMGRMIGKPVSRLGTLASCVADVSLQDVFVRLDVNDQLVAEQSPLKLRILSE